jgi:hypothetical protein
MGWWLGLRNTGRHPVLKQRYCSYKHTHLKRTPCREIAKGKTNFNAELWLRIYYYNATPKAQPTASILKYGRGRGRFPEQRRVLDSGRVRVRVGVRVWSLGGRGRAKREVVAGAPPQQRQTKWRCRRGISGGVTDMKMRKCEICRSQTTVCKTLHVGKQIQRYEFFL